MRITMARPITDVVSRFSQARPEHAASVLEKVIHELGQMAPAEASDAEASLVHLLNDRMRGDNVVDLVDLEALGALADRLGEGLEGKGSTSPERCETVWEFLDFVRQSAVLRRISAAGTTGVWAERIVRLVAGSNFTFGRLFAQRCATYDNRELFILPGGRVVTWRQAAQRVELFARGLLAVTDSADEGTVAILSSNSLDMALVDFACLSSGIVNVMIPATATEQDVAFILEHAGVHTLIAAADAQIAKAEGARARAPGLKRLIRLDSGGVRQAGIVPMEEVLERATEVHPEAVLERRAAVAIDDLATIMYTSGTTGTPKGIAFSHRNMVTKRFCRALALPEIGDDDRYLSFLPLFHTFGRFLELQGAVFWGATYCFAENPAIETLAQHMAELRPTIFISIPLKWQQLREQIERKVDLETADDDEIARAVRGITGGRLRWGLSAAGYLDPEIFRFFQSQNIELMSGFGMTEATGGITMTPPGEYREDSLGRPLPGIEVKLAPDGEMVMRGPYVMIGYFNPPDGGSSFDDEGWFPSGDLMELESNGHYRIVDRKKEIYKNVKGQTVAPQRVENLFRDIDSVGRIFLVGDHRPYNTALIYPNPDFDELDLSSLSSEELKGHFRSLVVTANSFLAPYERIVDFAMIDRDFSADKGELTPKGTYRRKTIERNFGDAIRLLYRRTTLQVGGADIMVDNWLFQAVGITTQDLIIDDDRLRLTRSGASLTIHRVAPDEVQVGTVVYTTRERTISLGSMLSIPRMWLGNQDLVDFADLGPELRDRHRRRRVGLSWARRALPYEATDLERQAAAELLLKQEIQIMDLHLASTLLDARSSADAVLAVRVLERIVELEEGPLLASARRVLRRAAQSRSVEVARRAIVVLARHETPMRYRCTIAAFFDAHPDLLDSETTAVLVEHDYSPERVVAFLKEAEQRYAIPNISPSELLIAVDLLGLVAQYGTAHPSTFGPVRAFLTRAAITARAPEIRLAARKRCREVEQSFRNWLGSSSRIAVDPETGFEYRWEDVIAFSEEVPEDDRHRLLAAIRSTPILREGGFLFSGGTAVRLSDILPGGVWIRLLGRDHGKAVYRIAIRTRHRGVFDLAVNLNHELTPLQVAEEIDWLVVCGQARGLPPLVEDFGGYWTEHDMWTEEFIPGETLDRALRRLSRRSEDADRVVGWWPFAAWSALGAYVDFWNRTGRRLVITDPVPSNVIVPTHDYHTGARLVSISSRQEFSSIASFLYELHDRFVSVVEEKHEHLRGLVGWDTVFSALLQIVGQDEGVKLLESVLAGDTRSDFTDPAEAFLASVQRRGFLPRRLFFAGKRFRRWSRLNPDATRFARARTQQELYDTYGLALLTEAYPESRARFFLETVFRDAPSGLAIGLETIVDQLRTGELLPRELSTAVADLRAHIEPGTEEDFFLARLSYPHLRPEDEAEYVAMHAGDGDRSEMVVTVEDLDGDPFRIRHVLNPKEVGRLHKLFLAAKLQVSFRPEHRFLVALNERGHLIGGLFYEVNTEESTAHMDKIVVAERFRRKGVAGELLEELCNRLRTAGAESLTTGFFRPQFFYRYGFTVERRYAGLVRKLGDSVKE